MIRKGWTALDYVLIDDDVCPICFGELDEGWECNECGCDFSPRPNLPEEETES